jgi:hypothetical protein
MNTTDAVHDHALAVVFEGITDPVKRTTFFRANKAAIARESARRTAGKPLPAAAPMPPKPFKLMKSGRDFRTVPAGGIFGALK